MTLPLVVKAKQRILHFDIENRPLSYWFNDMTTSEITAIAASWSDQKRVYSWIMEKPEDLPYILEEFVKMYNEADIVTGHYIRRHDLPIVTTALSEFGMSPLSPKDTSDTKLDLKKR